MRSSATPRFWAAYREQMVEAIKQESSSRNAELTSRYLTAPPILDPPDAVFTPEVHRG